MIATLALGLGLIHINPIILDCPSKTNAEYRARTLMLSFPHSYMWRVDASGLSMSPLITKEVLAVANWISYDQIRVGTLLVYVGRPSRTSDETKVMLHRAVQKDKDGWIMSGDNNHRSESWDRVTPDLYLGTVQYILRFP